MDGSQKAHSPRIVVIGAGIAGLAATLRLAAGGMNVTLIERHDHVGGKIRTVPSVAGPIDAGPTVLTMRGVFDELFAFAGEQLEAHVTMFRQETIARHFWPDGAKLDLFDTPEASAEAVAAFSSQKSADEFLAFSRRAKDLFEAFEAPMMRAPEPRLSTMVGFALRNPALLPAMAPLSTLKSLLASSFTDPRLRQLFGRYTTYVGGAPSHSPAILALISHAEAMGVWAIDGGIHKMAEAIAHLAERRGARIETGCQVTNLDRSPNGSFQINLADGRSVPANTVLYAGDPRALGEGRLGHYLQGCAPQTQSAPYSFSARVHSFAATPKGPELAHHNVFFDESPESEFRDLMSGALPENPSIYVCAMDRALGKPVPETERFEIITNAPSRPGHLEDLETWHPKIMQKMARYGMSFHPIPTHSTVTSEAMFAEMFPGSQGALYGQSPHGLLASFKRPTARTPLPNVYLAGGGCHPGAGVPMAALSGQHAVEAILNDRISASASHPMAMHGGTSTA